MPYIYKLSIDVMHSKFDFFSVIEMYALSMKAVTACKNTNSWDLVRLPLSLLIIAIGYCGDTCKQGTYLKLDHVIVQFL